ncbi:hypothetical protein D9613_003603 [Agrocybe pediades]|uniref:Uncharacterized protein n=1 Tax=Agrocybe pediades TaxID=84607 RepID=A0A8H4QIR5_9AGAR|nr:hypothetical protein D9613_003603 [Agrocybe pediades]
MAEAEDNFLLSPLNGIGDLRMLSSSHAGSPDSLNSVALLQLPPRALTSSPSWRSARQSPSPSPISSPVSSNGNYPLTPVTLTSPTLVASSPSVRRQSEAMIYSPASIRPYQQSPLISVRPPSEDGEDYGNESVIQNWALHATRGSPAPPEQFMTYAQPRLALSPDVRQLSPVGHSPMSESPSSSVSTHSSAPPWPDARVPDTWPFIPKSAAHPVGNDLPMFTFTEETYRKKHKNKKKKHSRRHRSTENSPVLPYTPHIGFATASNAYATPQPHNGLQGTSSPRALYNVSSYPPPPQIQPNANSYYTPSPYPLSGLNLVRSHSPQPYMSSQPPPGSPMCVEAPVIPPYVDPTDERGANNVCRCASWK